MKTQPYIYPDSLFTQALPAADCQWGCLRTRAQWEKKIALWLRAERVAHFLPVFEKETISHRKRRTSVLPLFGGYIFVAGDFPYEKLQKNGTWFDIIKPRSPQESRLLDLELKNLWHGLATATQALPVTTPHFAIGQKVRITSGPMTGVEGCILKQDQSRWLTLSLQILGTAVAVDLPEYCTVEPID